MQSNIRTPVLCIFLTIPLFILAIFSSSLFYVLGDCLQVISRCIYAISMAYLFFIFCLLKQNISLRIGIFGISLYYLCDIIHIILNPMGQLLEHLVYFVINFILVLIFLTITYKLRDQEIIPKTKSIVWYRKLAFLPGLIQLTIDISIFIWLYVTNQLVVEDYEDIIIIGNLIEIMAIIPGYIINGFFLLLLGAWVAYPSCKNNIWFDF